MLAKREERLNKKTKATGALPWMDIFSIVLGMLSSCRTPPQPAPVNPTPSPTAAQSQAWADAHKLKVNAESCADDTSELGYSGKPFNRLRAEIRRQRKRDGSPISKVEAGQAAADAFDDARRDTMVDLYHDVLEGRHAV